MAVVNREAISSNWKILQGRIKAENQARKPESRSTDHPATSAGVKRKRAPATGDVGRRKVATGPNSQTLPPRDLKKRRRTMGGYLSSNQASGQASDDHKTSDLIKDHDIAPSDLVAAYGTTSRDVNSLSLQSASKGDAINAGLHPTHKIGKFIALDCEMVGTGPPPDYSDNLLARVSVVNFHGEQIYDSYVQPPSGVKVEDYRTVYSGIRHDHLLPTTARTFSEVQQSVADILDGRILVGHALRNDLAVLMLSHPKRDVRDTSRHAKFRVASLGKAPALRNLAREELGMTIQTGEHSSLEDARATMMLFRKEKKAFEEDNRKKFGQPRNRGKVAAGKAGREMTPLSADGEDVSDEDEGDDESELLDGEEDELDSALQGGKGQSSASKGKKRKKKKKRTKRK